MSVLKSAKVWLGGRKGLTAPIRVSQYDTGWQFQLTVYNGDSIYVGSGDEVAVLNGHKANGAAFSVAGTFASGVATFDCPVTITEAVGVTDCELRLTSSGETVGTANFDIIVERAPLSGYYASGEDFSAVAQLIDNMVGRVPDAAADWLEDHITNPSNPPIDTSLSVSGAAADAKVVGSGFFEANSLDAFAGLLRMVGGQSNGITYEWSDSVCTVSGSATAFSANVLFVWTTLPWCVKPGKVYYLKINSSTSNVRIRIMFRDATETTISTVYAYNNKRIEVPSGAAAWTAALVVDSGVSLSSPATVSGIQFLLAPSNADLSELIYGGKDLDSNTAPGITYWSAADAGFNADNPAAPADIPLNVYTRVRGSVLGSAESDDNLWFKELDEAAYYFVFEVSPPQAPNVREYIILEANGGGTYRGRSINGGETVTWVSGDLSNDAGCRIYTYDDMTHGHYYRMQHLDTLGLLSFNPLDRLKSYSTVSCLLVPVRAGDRVVLRTVSTVSEDMSATGSKPYTLVGHNYLIIDEYVSSGKFNGEIAVTDDGFLAINMLDTYRKFFVCNVYTYGAARIRDSMFLAAQQTQLNRQALTSYDPSNITRVLKTGPSFMGMIHRWAVIGASYDAGEFNYTIDGAGFVSELEWYEYSPWSYLQRINGISAMYHYANGGTTAQEWLYLDPDAEYDSSQPEGGPGGHKFRCWVYETDEEEVSLYATSGGVQYPYRSGIGPGGGNWKKMLEDYRNGITYQAYVINLGGNDLQHYYPGGGDWYDPPADPRKCYACGTTADIGTYDIETDTDTPPSGRSGDVGVVPGVVNSYAAYIGAILNRILAVQPDAVIFLCTIRNGQQKTDLMFETWQEYNAVLKEIAAMPQFRDHVFIVDNGEHGPNWLVYPMLGMIVYAHPNAIGYQYVAQYFNTLIDQQIQDNYIKFRQSMFIGTGKKYTPIS